MGAWWETRTTWRPGYSARTASTQAWTRSTMSTLRSPQGGGRRLRGFHQILGGGQDDLAAGVLGPDGVDAGVDPLDHVDVALAPGGGAQAAELPPDLGVPGDVPGDVAGDALEDVAGLDQAQVGADLEAVGGGDGGGRLLGPLQGAGHHRGQRGVGEVAGQEGGLGLAAAREGGA